MTVAAMTGTAAGRASVTGLSSTPSGQSVASSLFSQSQLEASLKAGLRVIDQQQTVTFVKYVKLVLPLDGYVFWVKAELISESALQNVGGYNAMMFGQSPRVLSTAQHLVANGSLHIATTNQQGADESFSVNQVVFTSEIEVQDLNEVSPQVMYLATIEDFRFAFSERKSFYRQAGLHHYVGHAVYPVLEQQIIDDASVIDTRNVVVSNSLPIWLRLNRVLPVYPSFLVPDNIRPPYASIDINPSDTTALQPIPVIDRTGSHWQLARDRVKVTLFGLRNYSGVDYLDYVLAYMASSDDMGLMSGPIIRDEKRPQTEISAIAQKKSIEFEVSYYQQRARELARQLILEAIPTFYVGGGVEPVPIS
jgi:hypothetical protein